MKNFTSSLVGGLVGYRAAGVQREAWVRRLDGTQKEAGAIFEHKGTKVTEDEGGIFLDLVYRFTASSFLYLSAALQTLGRRL